MPKRNTASPPRPEMVAAVKEALAKLEKICPDPLLIGRCPELPGIALDRVMATPLDRSSPENKKNAQDYEKLRSEYLKALVAHPVGLALALLAVGPAGVESMEVGCVPLQPLGATWRPGAPTRFQSQDFNCHHIIPKSLRPHSDRVQINHPSNFVVTNTTRRGRDQSQNSHHLWHSLLLHPQTHNAPTDRPIPIYTVKPLFPFYPPITRGFRSVEELRKNLAALGSPPLPEVWEKRILEFSKATGHKAYRVPKEFQEITQRFGDLFKVENKDPKAAVQLREDLARQSERFAARFLPAGAYLNGNPLPDSHRPKCVLPVIESNPECATSVQALTIPKNSRKPSGIRKPAPRKATAQTATQYSI
jgi:hypothetical protein